MTNAETDVAEYPYTTKEPQVGMLFYNDLQFQLIEIPSTFNPESLNLVQSSDLIIVLLDANQDIIKQKDELMKLLRENRLDDKKTIFAKK